MKTLVVDLCQTHVWSQDTTLSIREAATQGKRSDAFIVSVSWFSSASPREVFVVARPGYRAGRDDALTELAGERGCAPKIYFMGAVGEHHLTISEPAGARVGGDFLRWRPDNAGPEKQSREQIDAVEAAYAALDAASRGDDARAAEIVALGAFEASQRRRAALLARNVTRRWAMVE